MKSTGGRELARALPRTMLRADDCQRGKRPGLIGVRVGRGTQFTRNIEYGAASRSDGVVKFLAVQREREWR